MKPIEKFYLAAPFFNKAQVELCQEIEIRFADSGVALFSPRQHKANSLDHKLTDADAIDIFGCNVENIKDATAVIAVVDWLLPSNQTIRLLETREPKPNTINFPDIKSGPLNIPDAGTVWEMGYAFANDLPIVMYTGRDNGVPVNIMLSQCCRGVCRGLSHLEQFLGKGDPFWACLEKWKGAHA